jgi:hypothetical protein
MSRAYRIRIKESINKDLTASDEVCSDLDILEILPADQMADLLADELRKRGFEEKEGKLVRERNGGQIAIDPNSGEVSIKVEKGDQIQLETEKEGWGFDDVGPGSNQIKQKLSDEAKAELERRAQRRQENLQEETTKELEGMMDDVRQELNDAVNSVTREALKRKAAQMGTIKEISEDPEAGSLTIKVEV